MNKEELINKIKLAFADVTLEDGIGLWEAQGIDDYADEKTMLELRKKDELYDWNKISFKDISLCSSSMSFFDAKGMRFCLPKFLITCILENELNEDEHYSFDLPFSLSLNKEADIKTYHEQRFSLFNSEQILCIIHYLEFEQEKIKLIYEDYVKNYNSSIDGLYQNSEYIELKNEILRWKEFMNKI